jgi:monothiol glutaredoxin
MTPEVRQKIEQQIGSNKVVLYMKGSPEEPMCGFSAAVVEVLDDMGVPYAHVNVLADWDVREGIKEYARWPTIPQLYVGGQFVGGCDIVREMHASGELKKVIEGAAAAGDASA